MVTPLIYMETKENSHRFYAIGGSNEEISEKKGKVKKKGRVKLQIRNQVIINLILWAK